MFKANLSLIFLLLLSITLKAQYAEPYKISQSVRQFEAGKEINTLSVQAGRQKEYYYNASASKIEIGLSEFEHFYLGYSLYKFNDKLADILSPRDFITYGPIIGGQFLFTKERVVTAKIGYRLTHNLIALQTDVGLNTDFKQTSYTVSPSIGLSLLELISPYYAYNHQFGQHSFSSLDTPHRLGVLILFPFKIWGAGGGS